MLVSSGEIPQRHEGGPESFQPEKHGECKGAVEISLASLRIVRLMRARSRTITSPPPCPYADLILEQVSVALNHLTGVVAGLVPATPGVEVQSSNRGGRDKPGHDLWESPSVST